VEAEEPEVVLEAWLEAQEDPAWEPEQLAVAWVDLVVQEALAWEALEPEQALLALFRKSEVLDPQEEALVLEAWLEEALAWEDLEEEDREPVEQEEPEDNHEHLLDLRQQQRQAWLEEALAWEDLEDLVVVPRRPHPQPSQRNPRLRPCTITMPARRTS